MLLSRKNSPNLFWGFSNFKYHLNQNYQQLILWLPVFFGVGIGLYFQLSFEPIFYNQIKIFALSALALYLFYYFLNKKNINIKNLVILIIMVYLGFLNANYHTYSIEQNYVKLNKKYFKNKINFEAEIISINEKEKGRQLLLRPIIINGEMQPENIMLMRLTLKKDFDIKVNDIIKSSALINAPPPPVLPDGYNFKRIAFFNKINAVGFIISNVEIIDHNQNNFFQFIDEIRAKIIAKIYANISSKEAAIATGLLTGERGKINKKDMENIRNSGLAHLLAISGLHITLVSVIFLVLLRNLLVLSKHITLKYDIKKIAAFGAILGSFIYLCLTQMPISGQRAFIMTSIILSGIIISRFNTPMRSVAIAATIIMIINPISILTPSFQMSFAAAIALISGFNAIENVSYLKISNRYLALRVVKYFLLTIISSLIAGFATLPFVLYHFQYWSKYGILSNVIAVPLTSIWIMPFGILSLILMPLGLEFIPLKLMSYGITIIIHVSEYVSSMKNNIIQIPAISNTALIIITLSLLWLIIWQTKIRKLSFIPLIIAFILCMMQSNPNMIIDGERKLIAVLDNDKIYLNKTRSSFKRDYWQQYFGIEYAEKLDNYKNFQCQKTAFNPYRDNKNFHFTSNSKKFDKDYYNCDLNYKDKKILLSSDINFIASNCQNYDMIYSEHLFPNDIDSTCFNKVIITKKDLIKNGTYLINFNKEILYRNVKDNIGNRPWQ